MALTKTHIKNLELSKILSDSYFQHHNPYTHKPKTFKYMFIEQNGTQTVETIKELVVHEFNMSDVEDPDLWAAESLYNWEKSEEGQWVMKNACDVPTWYRSIDTYTYGYKYQIKAKFSGPALTEMLLKHGNKKQADI